MIVLFGSLKRLQAQDQVRNYHQLNTTSGMAHENETKTRCA